MPLETIETGGDAVTFVIEALTDHGAECRFTLSNGANVYGTITDDGLFLPAPTEDTNEIGVATLLRFPQPAANELPTWVRELLPEFVSVPGWDCPGFVWEMIR